MWHSNDTTLLRGHKYRSEGQHFAALRRQCWMNEIFSSRMQNNACIHVLTINQARKIAFRKSCCVAVIVMCSLTIQKINWQILLLVCDNTFSILKSSLIAIAQLESILRLNKQMNGIGQLNPSQYLKVKMSEFKLIKNWKRNTLMHNSIQRIKIVI